MKQGLSTIKGGKQALVLGKEVDLEKTARLLANYYSKATGTSVSVVGKSDTYMVLSDHDKYLVRYEDENPIIVKEHGSGNDYLNGFSIRSSKYESDLSLRLKDELDILNFKNKDEVLNFMIELAKNQDSTLGKEFVRNYNGELGDFNRILNEAKEHYKKNSKHFGFSKIKIKSFYNKVMKKL